MKRQLWLFEGGIVAIVGMAVMVIAATVEHTARFYREGPMNRRSSVPALRFLKFSRVKDIGMGVQPALARLTAIRVTCLLATGLDGRISHRTKYSLAPEICLGRPGHARAERSRSAQSGRSLLCFQLPNGSISLTGNLLLICVLARLWGSSLVSSSRFVTTSTAGRKR